MKGSENIKSEPKSKTTKKQKQNRGNSTQYCTHISALIALALSSSSWMTLRAYIVVDIKRVEEGEECVRQMENMITRTKTMKLQTATNDDPS